MYKKIVAIAMGGYSSEFEISLKSGEVVYDAIDKTCYEVYKVHVLRKQLALCIARWYKSSR